MAGSIATKTGDEGKTSLIGGRRTSKADLRVEAYGNVDELNSALGFARSICPLEETRERTREIQKELFRIGSVLAAPEPKPDQPSAVSEEMVLRLTADVHRIEAIEGIVADWSLPGENTAAAAYDLARTVCRRAERSVVRLADEGEVVPQNVLAYLNRLSDLLWLFGRLLEVKAGVSGQMRDEAHPGPRWSRAW